MPKYAFEPDFNELLQVLNQKKPSRPVLFELFLNHTVYSTLSGHQPENDSSEAYHRMVIDGFHAGGYDYASVHATDFGFPVNKRESKSTTSLNEGFVITDQKSFDEYKWPDPESYDYSLLKRLGEYKPDGMKLMVLGPCGVLENVIMLTGYENLCFMLLDERELVTQIFNEVGSRLLKYYQISAEYDSVGVIMANDDWGFNTQTFLSPSDMREFVFPWHKKIVEAAHANNKPAVLHSCGFAGEIMEDIIEDIKFNGRHSYEDVIMPVEEFYPKWGRRIGIMGGMDVDFLTKASTGEIQKRCGKMLDMAEDFGSYALGSGNSIPEYIPYDNYKAMIDTANSRR